MNKLSTYPHRKLTDREIVKLIGWIPIQLILYFGPEEAKQIIRAVLKTKVNAIIDNKMSVDKMLILRGPLASLEAITAYHINGYCTQDYMPSEQENQLDSALEWILNHFDTYIIAARQLSPSVTDSAEAASQQTTFSESSKQHLDS